MTPRLHDSTTSPGFSSHRFPFYGVIGLLVMAVSETGMLLQVEPFWSWHTPIAWTGYILFVDGLVWRLRGSSWLTTARGELAFLAVASFPLWLVFEFFNLFIRNWHYINLPGSAALRNLGYFWAFATIWPAIFETADLVAVWRTWRRPARATHDAWPIPQGGVERHSRFSALEWLSMVAGGAMLAWPLIWPSRYLAAPVWLGFIFLLDPINRRAGGESLGGDLRARRPGRMANLMIAGLVCGVVWESWNYWARTKWVYTVPILENLKVFEMPLPGYVGFPAFALECFTMYVTVRLLVWHRPGRPIAL